MILYSRLNLLSHRIVLNGILVPKRNDAGRRYYNSLYEQIAKELDVSRPATNSRHEEKSSPSRDNLFKSTTLSSSNKPLNSSKEKEPTKQIQSDIGTRARRSEHMTRVVNNEAVREYIEPGIKLASLSTALGKKEEGEHKSNASSLSLKSEINKEIIESEKWIQIHLPKIIAPKACNLIPRIYPVIQPENPRLLRVAILGPANSGKSTLLNSIMKEKISIVSSKAQTTRQQIQSIYTRDNTQIIFYDTPGLAPPKIRLPRYMATAPWTALEEVDLILYVMNASFVKRDILYFSLEAIIRRNLASPSPLPIYLVMNKTDLVKDQATIAAIRAQVLNKVPDIQKTFPCSALHGTGLDNVLNMLVAQALPSPWKYAAEQKHLFSDVEFVLEMVREKIFHKLHQEVPYLVKLELASWDDTIKGHLKINFILHVKSESQKAMIIGKNACVLNYISNSAAEDLLDYFKCRVQIFFNLRVSPNYYHL